MLSLKTHFQNETPEDDVIRVNNSPAPALISRSTFRRQVEVTEMDINGLWDEYTGIQSIQIPSTANRCLSLRDSSKLRDTATDPRTPGKQIDRDILHAQLGYSYVVV